MCRWLAYSGSPGAPRGPALQAEELPRRPEQALADGRRRRPTATASASAGTARSRPPGCSAAPSPPGTTSTCASCARTPRPRGSSPTSAPRRARPCSRPTATRSATRSWLWMHNGYLAGFHEMKRDLAMEVDPDLFADIQGSTDSEMLFFLALSFGLRDDPRAGVARAVGLVEEVGRSRGIEFPVQMTVATTDGDTTWAFRYSSEGRSRSLFQSTDVSTLRSQYPDNPVLHELSGRRPARGVRAAGRPAGCLARDPGVVERHGARGRRRGGAVRADLAGVLSPDARMPRFRPVRLLRRMPWRPCWTCRDGCWSRGRIRATRGLVPRPCVALPASCCTNARSRTASPSGFSHL